MAPPRTLTREDREQIRYLHEEFPESWSVPRLAEGLDISSNVIRRVLKSKFVPTLEKKQKQDEKVLLKAGPAHSLHQLAGPGEAWELLSAGRPVSGGNTSSQGHDQSTALRVTEPNTQRTNTTRRQKGRNKGFQSLEKESFVPVAAAQGQHRELQKYFTSGCEDARGSDSDGLPSAK
ncbi:neugrin-like [Eptesicus fuscus]|uniref:neugrin-like n=1 Tax=Eptesicus fuscus TaxID=29078 RepID=UPI002403CDB9|nr:neugrin-like [Eptesicus fuscus]